MRPWLSALERRHLANLSAPEVTRALRALSSCYVERRARLSAALEGAGKRAAFAAFYGPLHFLTVREIVRALGACDSGQAHELGHGHELGHRPRTRTSAPETIVDLGCGTGVGAAAWALECNARPRVIAVDQSRWAVSEANWTYRELGVSGSATSGDMTNVAIPTSTRSAVLAAFAVNELDAGSRSRLLTTLVAALRGGIRLLIVEAIARRDKPWWPEWRRALEAEGARADEWRFDAEIPPLVRELGRRGGLGLTELTARTIARV